MAEKPDRSAVQKNTLAVQCPASNHFANYAKH